MAAMLIRDGHAQHPYIGVALRDVRDLDPVERVRWGERLPARGALVSRIIRDAPAANAGLRAGDVITTINDRDIPAAAELADLVSTQEVGARLMVGFVRRGASRTVPISVADQASIAATIADEGL
jgi:S1-C subfamily serine protease